MSYAELLHPWCIVRHLPNLQRLTVARFRRRNDALAHMQVLQRLVPGISCSVIFEPPAVSRDRSGL
jgi:hypothetical protein